VRLEQVAGILRRPRRQTRNLSEISEHLASDG
jgi:hypothetical protein